MPRSIDGIVSAHRHANELRKQGKPIWASELAFKSDALALAKHQGVKAGAARAAAQLRAAFLRRLNFGSEEFDPELFDIVEWFEMIANEAGPSGDDAVEEFDSASDQLYDWADAHRVWLS